MSEERELGTYLRECRESLGRTHRQVADVLHIRPAYLAAMEKGDFSQLPGKAYVRGFLQRYAEHLGLDVAQVLARYEHSVAPLPVAPLTPSLPMAARVRPSMKSPRRLPLRAIAATAACILFAGAVWYGLFSPPQEEAAQIAEDPQPSAGGDRPPEEAAESSSSACSPLPGPPLACHSVLFFEENMAPALRQKQAFSSDVIFAIK